MKIAFGVAAAVLFIAAPGRASTPARQGATDPKPVVDPQKWNYETERNSASQWFTVTIEGQKYLAYQPTAAERKTGKYRAKDQGYLWETPVFKMTVSPKDEKEPNKAHVMTQATALILEFPAKNAKLQPKVRCTDPAQCKDVKVADAKILGLDSDPSGLPGFSTSDKKLVLVVMPPGAAMPGGEKRTGTDQADTTPALGAWENAANDTIAKPNDEDKKQDKTNADRRKTLLRHLQTYLDAAKDKTTALDTTEIDFIKRVAKDQNRALPLDGFDEAAKANKDSSNPASAAFIKRWRKFISDDVSLYLQFGDSNRPQFQGNAGSLGLLNKDVRDNGTGATSELEVALAKAHPGASRMDEAQRKIMAAYIKAHLKNPPDPKDKDQALLRAASTGDKAAYDKVWARITYKGHLEQALAGNDRGIDLGKLVDRDTLLDAYCDPNKFHGGASAAQPKAKAMDSARAMSKDSRAAATGGGIEQTGTGGGQLEGSGAAAVNANDPCSGRLRDLQSKFPDAPVNGSPTLVDKPTGVDTDNHNHTGGDKHDGDKFVKGNDHGPNQGPQNDPGDPNFGDHVRSGANVGAFLGLVGLFTGGPIGMLVLGGAGFALGYGIDKLTNKKSS